MKSQKRSSFHHGNLREALLDAAFEILDETGPDAITIREVARRTGVSHAAPVNHFKDRTSLLTAVATKLFTELADAINHELEEADPVASKQAGAFAKALIAYGISNPHRYNLLWRRDLVDNSDPDLQTAMDSIYDELIAKIETSRKKPKYDQHTIAIALWSLAHGYVSMRSDGNFEPMKDLITGQNREDAMIDSVLAAMNL
jgi:AcrR family transcriptional regulator